MGRGGGGGVMGGYGDRGAGFMVLTHWTTHFQMEFKFYSVCV